MPKRSRGAGEVAGMISLPAGTHIWIAAGVTDMRRGFIGLAAMQKVKMWGRQGPPLNAWAYITATWRLLEFTETKSLNNSARTRLRAVS